MSSHPRSGLLSLVVLTTAVVTACTASPRMDPASSGPTATVSVPARASASGRADSSAPTPVVPTPVVSPAGPSAGVYAGARAGALAPAARQALPRIYVPDSISNRVDVIDPATLRVVDHFPVGREPQHVVPSWDLRTLWVNDDLSNDLVPIDARTGRPGRPVPVADPYNLYFTPDGRHALVMAERLRRIDVRDPHSMALQRSIPIPCRGVNHADFTADGRYLLASCEYSGKLVVVDATRLDRVVRVVDLNPVRTPGATPAWEAAGMGGPTGTGGPAGLVDPGVSSMPQDVRLLDDGSGFVVADMLRNGVWVIDARTWRITRFLPTGRGAHGIYPSRDATRLFVSNRDGASVSVLDARAQRVITTWRLAPGSSPDMGGVSADGRRLYLSGRYDGVVYVIDTGTGRVLATIAVGKGPHGLAVWPQPGQHSLGHTGNMR